MSTVGTIINATLDSSSQKKTKNIRENGPGTYKCMIVFKYYV